MSMKAFLKTSFILVIIFGFFFSRFVQGKTAIFELCVGYDMILKKDLEKELTAKGLDETEIEKYLNDILNEVKNDIITEFQEHGIETLPVKSSNHYIIKGKIEIRHFDREKYKYAITMEVRELEILAQQYIHSLPSLIFKSFTTRGAAPAKSDIRRAICYARDNLLDVMGKKGIFLFHQHPLFAHMERIEPIRAEDLEELNNKELWKKLEQLIEKFEASIALTQHFISKKFKDHARDMEEKFQRFSKELEKLKEKPLNRTRLITEIAAKKTKLDFSAFGSILVVVIANTPLAEPFFKATIQPETTCEGVKQPQIMGWVKRIKSADHFYDERQYKRYGQPYIIKTGHLKKEGSQYIITISCEKYKGIFIVNTHGWFRREGELLDSMANQNTLFMVQVSR